MSLRGDANHSGRLRSTRSGLLASMALIALVGISAGSGTWAAFTATTPNAGSRFESGNVTIGDNDGGSTPMLSLSAALPGATDTGCITVSYTGSLPSTVRLYGATTGTGLDQYLDLKVTRGTYTPSQPAFDSCTNFQTDGTEYIVGKGNGVVYDGPLQGFPDTYLAGLVDPTSGSPESWTTGEAHVYRVQVTLQNNTGAEGKNATQSFIWEARNQ